MPASWRRPADRLIRGLRELSRLSSRSFFPPGPWKVMVNLRYFETPSADPVYLYQNALVALDAQRGSITANLRFMRHG